jgi:hypothetical protein
MKAIRCPAGPPKAVKLKIKTCFRKFKLDDLNYYLVKVKFAFTIIMAFIQISCNVGLKQNILYNYDIKDQIRSNLSTGYRIIEKEQIRRRINHSERPVYVEFIARKFLLKSPAQNYLKNISPVTMSYAFSDHFKIIRISQV